MAVDFSPLQTSANEARSASTLAQNLKAIKQNEFYAQKSFEISDQQQVLQQSLEMINSGVSIAQEAYKVKTQADQVKAQSYIENANAAQAKAAQQSVSAGNTRFSDELGADGNPTLIIGNDLQKFRQNQLDYIAKQDWTPLAKQSAQTALQKAYDGYAGNLYTQIAAKANKEASQIAEDEIHSAIKYLSTNFAYGSNEYGAYDAVVDKVGAITGASPEQIAYQKKIGHMQIDGERLLRQTKAYADVGDYDGFEKLIEKAVSNGTIAEADSLNKKDGQLDTKAVQTIYNERYQIAKSKAKRDGSAAFLSEIGADEDGNTETMVSVMFRTDDKANAYKDKGLKDAFLEGRNEAHLAYASDQLKTYLRQNNNGIRSVEEWDATKASLENGNLSHLAFGMDSKGVNALKEIVQSASANERAFKKSLDSLIPETPVISDTGISSYKSDMNIIANNLEFSVAEDIQSGNLYIDANSNYGIHVPDWVEAQYQKYENDILTNPSYGASDSKERAELWKALQDRKTSYYKKALDGLDSDAKTKQEALEKLAKEASDADSKVRVSAAKNSLALSYDKLDSILTDAVLSGEVYLDGAKQLIVPDSMIAMRDNLKKQVTDSNMSPDEKAQLIAYVDTLTQNFSDSAYRKLEAKAKGELKASEKDKKKTPEEKAGESLYDAVSKTYQEAVNDIVSGKSTPKEAFLKLATVASLSVIPTIGENGSLHYYGMDPTALAEFGYDPTTGSYRGMKRFMDSDLQIDSENAQKVVDILHSICDYTAANGVVYGNGLGAKYVPAGEGQTSGSIAGARLRIDPDTMKTSVVEPSYLTESQRIMFAGLYQELKKSIDDASKSSFFHPSTWGMFRGDMDETSLANLTATGVALINSWFANGIDGKPVETKDYEALRQKISELGKDKLATKAVTDLLYGKEGSRGFNRYNGKSPRDGVEYLRNNSAAWDALVYPTVNGSPMFVGGSDSTSAKTFNAALMDVGIYLENQTGKDFVDDVMVVNNKGGFSVSPKLFQQGYNVYPVFMETVRNDSDGQKVDAKFWAYNQNANCIFEVDPTMTMRIPGSPIIQLGVHPDVKNIKREEILPKAIENSDFTL